jgi:hypothetical protein
MKGVSGSRRLRVFGLLLSGLPLAASLVSFEANQDVSRDWPKTAIPFFEKFCITCHQGESAPGGIDLKKLRDAKAAMANRAAFDFIAERIKSGSMPPPGAPQPTAAQRDAALTSIQRLFAQAPPPPPDPGRVTIRRLNRLEYDNTVRDLLGIETGFSADFPNDDVGYGFDNIGDVLTLSPLLFEKYLNAAEKAAAEAIALPEKRSWAFDGGQMVTDLRNNQIRDGSLGLYSAGFGAVDFDVPRPGPYRLKIVAWAQQAGPEPAKMAVRLDRDQLAVFDVRGTEGRPESFELPLTLGKGTVRLSAHFLNDYYQPQHADPKMRGDRNLYLRAIEVHGPLVPEKPKSASHACLIRHEPDPKDPLPAAKRNLAEYLRRAFRRPVDEDEVGRYAGLVQAALKEGESFEQGMRVAVAAALVSPHFLFRVELDERKAGARTRLLNDHELASRLAYFLWSSMPDAELFALADAGRLRDVTVLKQQALRMLKDPKARALTDGFATQWLTLRKLETASPDPELFPSFDDGLREDMRKETEHFFAEVVRSDRSVVEFLDAPYTFVNERLAKHYGIPGVIGPSLRKVELKGAQRGGLLTMASVLTVTSNPNRTSPVKRGKWVLENILGEPPPPPPPGLDSLEGDEDKVPAKTIKERMAKHRRDPSCAVCHAKMDPLGIAFENYDPVGKWRTMDGRFKVDATGETALGEKFAGAADLKKILLKRKGAFVETLAEKLSVYALGRGLELADRKAVRTIAANASKEGHRFSALVKGIVASDAFRKKRVG